MTQTQFLIVADATVHLLMMLAAIGASYYIFRFAFVVCRLNHFSRLLKLSSALCAPASLFLGWICIKNFYGCAIHYPYYWLR